MKHSHLPSALLGRIQFKLLSAILLLLLVCLQYKLWCAPDGMKDVMLLKKQLANQTQLNNMLRKQNDVLLHQVHYLQTNQDATESRARHELGMIKKDETFYQIIKSSAAPANMTR